MILDLDDRDIETFGNLPPTTVNFYSARTYMIFGGIYDWLDPSRLESEATTIQNEIRKQVLTTDQQNQVDDMCGQIKNYGSYTLYRIMDALNILLGIVNQKNEDVINMINNIKKKFEIVREALPTFVYLRDTTTLKRTYSIEVFNGKSKNQLKSDDPLYMLLQIVGYDIEKIDDMLKSTSTAYKASALDRLNELVDTAINRPFLEFYKQEKVTLKFDYDGPNLLVHVKSSGNTMDISERSDGLQWYLNLFIQLQHKNLTSRNLVYLLDEPGVHLHVNAQKDILHFFDSLVQNKNQIIYTTHSPFMINIDRLGSVRALEKDEYGCTKIYNSVFNAALSPISKMDTLSPVVSALGMDLKHTIGPRSDSINIITEGISEYYYLLSMIKHFGFSSEKYCILPANGADAIINVCSILTGWGYNFTVLCDLDSKGVSACKVITKDFGLRVHETVHFLADVENNNWWEKAYYENNKCEIEDLISPYILQQIRIPGESGEPIGKMITAKRFFDGVLKGSITPDKDTCEKFSKLFIRVGIKALEISVS